MEILSQEPTRNQKNIFSQTRNTRHSRLVSWHQGEYRELVLFVAASARPLADCRGYVWRVLDGSREIESGIGTTHGLSEAATEETAAAAGKHWIRTHTPNARVRLRSSLQRRMLFGNPPAQRRRAA